MHISEVQIVPVKPSNGLIAFASCVIDNAIYLGSIAIFVSLNGSYRLVFPTKLIGDHHINYHHPINSKTHQKLEQAILSKARSIFS